MPTHRKHNVLERRIFNLIREDDINTFHANLIDGFLIVLVIISVIVAFLSTFDLKDETHDLILILETIFIILFTIEYLLRIWTAELMYENLSPWRSRLKYALTPMAMIDLFSILPFYLPLVGISVSSLNAIRIIRLLRIFKINRYTHSLTLIWMVLKKQAAQLFSSILVILVLMFIAAMLMYDVEHIAQPEVFDNALSAMWWAMATITTVGYGDIYPITTVGRILSAFITFMGIGLTAIPTGILSAGFITQSREIKEMKDRENASMDNSNLGDTRL